MARWCLSCIHPSFVLLATLWFFFKPNFELFVSRLVGMQNSLTYATRVRTIKNEVTKMESSKEMLKLKRQLEYWKEQAGLSPEQRKYVDLEDITDERHRTDED